MVHASARLNKRLLAINHNLDKRLFDPFEPMCIVRCSGFQRAGLGHDIACKLRRLGLESTYLASLRVAKLSRSVVGLAQLVICIK